jgi:hypothetical protein
VNSSSLWYYGYRTPLARRHPLLAGSRSVSYCHHRRGVTEKRPWSVGVEPGNGTRHLQKNKDDAKKQMLKTTNQVAA